MSVSVSIPVSKVIAGEYRVGLNPRDKQGATRAFKVGDRVWTTMTNWSPEIAHQIGVVTDIMEKRGTVSVQFPSRPHPVEIPVGYLKPAQGEMVLTSKTAVSLPALVQQTNAFSQKHRPGCAPVLEKSDPKNLYLQYRVTCHNEDYNDPNGHEVRVQFDVSKIKDSQKANDLDIQCSCSCPAFLYWGAQWNLHQRDGLLGEPRPKLQAPTERLDLRTNFVICKHCKVVFERILPSVQHNINNIIRKKKVEEHKQRQKGPTGVAPESTEDLERMEELEREETKRMLQEDQGVVERETPATPEEKKKHPVLEPTPKPRWKSRIDKMKGIMRGWPTREKEVVPTPEKPKPPALAPQEPVSDELPEPLTKEHPRGPHVDTGLPYEPRWKKYVKKLKDRFKTWGKPKASAI